MTWVKSVCRTIAAFVAAFVPVGGVSADITMSAVNASTAQAFKDRYVAVNAYFTPCGETSPRVAIAIDEHAKFLSATGVVLAERENSTYFTKKWVLVATHTADLLISAVLPYNSAWAAAQTPPAGTVHVRRFWVVRPEATTTAGVRKSFNKLFSTER
jgi:hypothetical protein